MLFLQDLSLGHHRPPVTLSASVPHHVVHHRASPLTVTVQCDLLILELRSNIMVLTNYRTSILCLSCGLPPVSSSAPTAPPWVTLYVELPSAQDPKIVPSHHQRTPQLVPRLPTPLVCWIWPPSPPPLALGATNQGHPLSSIWKQAQLGLGRPAFGPLEQWHLCFSRRF
jgi:hypothetical protein